MEILLVRHAAAFERDSRRWPDDGERPLTRDGARRFRKHCRSLGQIVSPVAHVLTSPLVRTRETAEILRDAAEWGRAIDCAQLAPGQSPAAVLKVLRTQAHERVALVGHEPNLSELLAASIAGMDASVRVAFKKGAIASVTFDAEARVGRGCLDWMLPPRLLREMD